MIFSLETLLDKLEHGYHGRALNANGPNTHYRNVYVVNVIGPDFVCDPTDPMIEGTPIEKGFAYDREIWDKVVEKVTSSNLSRISPSHLFCRSAISRSFCVFSLTIGNLRLARDLENSYRAVVARHAERRI